MRELVERLLESFVGRQKIKKLADAVGCTPATVYTWLNGVEPSPVFEMNLRRLADERGVSVEGAE